MNGPDKEPAYESLFNRSVAALIDNALWFVASFYLLGLFPESTWEDNPEIPIAVFLVLASAWFNYFAFCEWRWGQTVGKKAMGMRVVPLDGGEMTFGPASIRNVLRIVDFFLIGPMMIANSARRQRLGDKLAGTVVLRARPVYAPVAAAAAATPAAAVAAPAPSEPEPEDAGGGFPWVTWGPRRTVWGLVAGLALAALFAPLLIIPFDPDLDSTAGILAAQALLAIALTGTALYFARQPGPVGVREALARLGWRRFKPSHVALGFGVLIAYYIAVAIYASFVVEPSQDDIGGDLGLDEGPLAATLAVLLIVVAAPLAEESFFRGFVFGGLRSKLSLWPAAIISGVVFGAIHAPSGPTTVVPLALLGVALAFLYDRTGSLWPPIILHAFNNALALAVSA